MKKAIKLFSLFFVLTLSLTLLFSCKDNQNEQNDEPKYTELPAYDTSKLSDYIEPFEYTGLSIEKAEGTSDADAVWSAVISNAKIKLYPKDQLAYYEEQEIIKYKYFASKEDVDYDELLKSICGDSFLDE